MPDRRNAVKHGPFTTWQWAVIGSYLATIILSAVLWQLAHRADVNSKRGNIAICVEVGFLVNSEDTTTRIVEKNEHVRLRGLPTDQREAALRKLMTNSRDPLTPERARSLISLRRLIDKINATIHRCSAALR